MTMLWMWLVLFSGLMAAALAGFVISFTRLRLGAPPIDDRLPGDPSPILPEEWERVRTGQCGPTRCPRAIGYPPRPRKDSHCEICAAMFLERYWKRLLGDSTWREFDRPPRSGLGSARGSGERLQRVGLDELPMVESATTPPVAPHRHARSLRWGRRLFIGGLIVFLAGVVIAGLAPWPYMLPGYAVCAVGMACLFRGAGSGAI